MLNIYLGGGDYHKKAWLGKLKKCKCSRLTKRMRKESLDKFKVHDLCVLLCSKKYCESVHLFLYTTAGGPIAVQDYKSCSSNV